MTPAFELEHRLLALCAHPCLGGEAVRPFPGLSGGALRWDYLLGAARRLGALPLLYRVLARLGVDAPPEAESLGRLARVSNSMRMVLAERQMEEIRAAFERASIPFLVLKGLPLAHELYPEPALRPVGDLDLLVRLRSRDAALAILASMGYRLPAEALPMQFYRLHHFHVLMVRAKEENRPVELHWRPHSHFSLSHIPEDDLWGTVRGVRAGGQEVRVPGREENYLLLVQHLHRHLLGGNGQEEDPVSSLLDPAIQGRLFWFTDLILLAGEPQFDRERMRRLAVRWSLEDELEEVSGILARLGARARGESANRGAVRAGARNGYSAARAISRRFPVLARQSRRLQFRLALIGEVWHLAFPGAEWIRRRYGLGSGSAVRTFALSAGHLARVSGRLAGMAGSALAGMALKGIRRRNTHPDESFTPPGNCEIAI